MASNSLSAAGKSVLRSTMSPSGAGGGGGATDAAIERNPFILPSDSDIFKLREEERIRRDEMRTTLASKKVWEKTNYSSAMTQTRKMIESIVPDVDPHALAQARQAKGLVSAATAAIARDRRHEKETLQEFVQKKRDMFLVQMSLDIKREEIAKMEATAAAREAALRASEAGLEDEAVRFDGFLKANDAAAHDALKKAELQAKLKAEKMHELKKLKHAIGVVAAEKGKLREVLTEYERYKAFLDELTPQEWIDARRAEQMALRVARKQASFDKKFAVWEEAKAARTREVTEKAEADRKASLRRGMQPVKVDIEAVVQASIAPPPLLEDETLPELTEEEMELPMYFTDPIQLLEIFTQLEESNLFLIQNCQDIEAQIEELKVLHTETTQSMATETTALEEQMATLRAQLAAEEAKAAALRRKVANEAAAAAAATAASASTNDDLTTAGGAGSGGAGAVDGAAALDGLLPELRTRIVEVYERCGFKANASSDTISMLTALEGKLEALLSELTLLEPEYVALKEKEKERARRIRVRSARLRAAHEAHEIRQKKMLERAQAPVVKRVGKPVMFRSILPKRVLVTQTLDPEAEREREEAVFFS